MENSNKKFKPWFVVLTGVLVLTNVLVFGLFTILHPELPWPDLGKESAFPIQFFGIRHLAFGLVLFHGLIKRNAVVLKAVFHIFFLISVMDIILLLWKSYYVPVLVRWLPEMGGVANAGLAVVMFLIPMVLCIRYLNKYGS